MATTSASAKGVTLRYTRSGFEVKGLPAKTGIVDLTVYQTRKSGVKLLKPGTRRLLFKALIGAAPAAIASDRAAQRLGRGLHEDHRVLNLTRWRPIHGLVGRQLHILAVLAAAAVLGVLALAPAASADRAHSQRYVTSQKGSVIHLGNTLETCPGAGQCPGRAGRHRLGQQQQQRLRHGLRRRRLRRDRRSTRAARR